MLILVNYMTPPFYMTAFWSIITTILDICKVQILDNNMQFLETILDSVKMTIISHKNLQNTEIRNSCAFYSREGKHKCFYFGHFFFSIYSLSTPPSFEILPTQALQPPDITLKVWKWQLRSLLKGTSERTKVNRKMSKA